MTSIVSLGCDVAEIHHRYNAIHSALFGAASFRLVIAAMAGRTGKTYRGYITDLARLRNRLSQLAEQIPTADLGVTAHQALQLRETLNAYATTLDTAIAGLGAMCDRLVRDEDGYRHTPEGGQSELNRDKRRDDQVLVQLEQLGSRLNRLFARY